MKILIAHNHYLEKGGEDRVVESEIELLRKSGHEVIYYERSNEELQSLPLPQKISFFFKDIIDSDKTYKDIVALIKKNKPDIAHIHNIFFMITPAIYRALKQEGVTVVQTLHNFRFLCINGIFYRDNRVCDDCTARDLSPALRHRCFRNSFLLSFFLKRNLGIYHKSGIFSKNIDAYIALNRFSRSKFIASGFPPEKIFVKPNFIEQPEQAEKPHTDTAIFIGRLADYKGIATLMRAYSDILKGCRLKIIGDGPLSEYVKKEAARTDNIEYLGSLPYPETLNHIQTASFLAFPSECYENMPRAIIEAFACGVPVIAGNIGAAAEMVKPGFTGLLFQPSDKTGLAEKVKYLMQNKDLLGQMRVNAYQEYKTKYTPDVNYNMLMDIYKKALTARAGIHE